MTSDADGLFELDGPAALVREVDQARQAGIVSQQLARFASGRVKQSHEVLQLEEVLKNVLQLRARETQARGIELKPQLKSARVIVDGSLPATLSGDLGDSGRDAYRVWSGGPDGASREG